MLVDLVVLCLAASAALFGTQLPVSATARWLAAGFPVLSLVMLHARRGPDQHLSGSALATAAHVLGTISLAAMLSVAADSILGATHPVALTLRLWLFSTVYLLVARLVLLWVRNSAVQTESLATPTLVVGAGIVGKQLVKRLTVERRYGLRPVGFLDSDPVRSEPALTSPVPVLGPLEHLGEAVQSTGARHVILAFTSEPDHVLLEIVKECERLGIEVSLVPRLFESISARAVFDHVGGLPLLSLRPTDPRGWQFVVKHVFDRMFALLALIALAPLMLVIAVAVRLSSPGPVLFRQRRVGRDGREFDLLKFRTMYDGYRSDGFVLPEGLAPGGVEGEDRRTRVGRHLRNFSVDELPQLINVLRGDMSLVGPRPERPNYVQRFTRTVARYEDRHRVKSGITGLAQVHGLRGQTSIVDRVEWDNWYIQNWSLWLDLRILMLTVGEILRLRS